MYVLFWSCILFDSTIVLFMVYLIWMEIKNSFICTAEVEFRSRLN